MTVFLLPFDSRRVDAVPSSSSRFAVESLPEDEFRIASSSSSSSTHHRNVQPRRRLNDDDDDDDDDVEDDGVVVGDRLADGEGGADNQRGGGSGGGGRDDPSRRRDPREEVEDEPLIILDPYGVDGSDPPIGAPLDLRRELVPGESGASAARYEFILDMNN